MKCPTNSEIFTFPTQEDRKEFLTELSLRFPDARYATALDPEGDRWLVAIPVDQYNMQEADDKKRATR